MLLTANRYADAKAIVNRIGAGATMDGLFYTEINGEVTGLWAVFMEGSLSVVCGGKGDAVGVSVADLLLDFPAAQLMTTEIAAES